MLKPLKPQTVIGEYRVLQCVGKSAGVLLYLANRGATPWLFWLLQSAAPVEQFRSRVPDEQTFEHQSDFFLATPVSGSSLATLTQCVRTFEWKFIAARFAEIVGNVAFLHSKNQVYQRDHPLNLQSIVFNSAGEAVILSAGTTRGAREFPPPEAERAIASPASDVYSLGMAMAYLISDDNKRTAAPVSLINVLKRATAPDPAKRYRHAGDFAQDLAEFLPKVKALHVRRHAPNLFPVIAFSVIVLLLLTGAIIFYFARELVPTSSTADTQTLTRIAEATATPPPGPLRFDSLGATLDDNCNGSLDTVLSKGGQSLKGGGIDFEVVANGAPVQMTQPMRDAGATGQYRGAFSLGAGCFEEGTLRVRARIGGASASRAVYARRKIPNLPNPPNPGGKKKLAVGLFQLDMQKHPQMTGYFGLTDESGNANRLQGTTGIQILQDGTDVTDAIMTPVDSNATPLTAALVLDVSGSMQGNPMTQARVAAISFVNQLGQNDSACIYTFSTTVNRPQNCTTDKNQAIRALATLNSAGNTALYDAMVAVAGDHAKLTGRQTIIILSDGADTASKSSQADAAARLKQTNIPLYTIGLAGKDFNPTILKQFAVANGGSYLETPNATDLRGLYERIQGQLKNQYRIAFQSLDPNRTSGTVTIRLTTEDQVIEATRTYVVGK